MTSRNNRALLGAVLAAVVATTGLSACAPLIVGGAMAGGALMYADRRSTGAQVDDEAIELKAGARVRDAAGSSAHINVTSFNRIVLLTGEVASEERKAAAQEAAAKVDNVRSVVNELAILGSSSMTSRSNDTLITSKVKTALIDSQDIQANAIKVVTERSTVYLMGIVSEREATRAAEVARGIGGVQRVVRVFEVVPEEELQRRTPR